MTYSNMDQKHRHYERSNGEKDRSFHRNRFRVRSRTPPRGRSRIRELHRRSRSTSSKRRHHDNKSHSEKRQHESRRKISHKEVITLSQRLLDKVPEAKNWTAIELDVNTKLTPLQSYAEDREFLIEKLFSLLNSDELLGIAKSVGFEDLNIGQIEVYCRRQLEDLPITELVSIIEGKDMQSETLHILPDECDAHIDEKDTVKGSPSIGKSKEPVSPKSTEDEKHTCPRTELEQIEIETRARLVQSILTKRYSPPALPLEDSSSESSADSVLISRHIRDIDGIKIYHEIHGNGPSTLLLIHGSVGSTKDFDLQLRKGGLNLDEFTVVAVDLPGYGRSKPPVREFSNDLYETDAEAMMKLMKELNFKTYSVAGWDDGAKVAAFIAIKYPGRVNCLILWGFVPHLDDHSCRAIGRTRDVELFDPVALEYYESVYGYDEFVEQWHKYVDFIVSSMRTKKRYDMREKLTKIKCPTLIVHGDIDPIVDYNLHVKTTETLIPDSFVVHFNTASHNIHQSYSNHFNEVMSGFIISTRS
ncbi:Valacyclovir hydrolase [Fragariocoptes setiger]|uniref:Valacyclovir hydrolase n=1 Tax=Fragariocoptes setiger TaxID=1670756 RepID=A0ABQ7S9J3_9ACAR|nr:Valacyclovir hydrolase [Fragariocoptes setiger]